jgi:hypothetical protein
MLEATAHVRDLIRRYSQHIRNEGFTDRLTSSRELPMERVCDAPTTHLRRPCLEPDDLLPHPGRLGTSAYASIASNFVATAMHRRLAPCWPTHPHHPPQHYQQYDHH